MSGKSPVDNAKGAFSQFIQVVAEYPYAKIWCFLWLIFCIIAFIGGIMLALETRAKHGPSYHMSVKNAKSVRVPALRFDIVSGISDRFIASSCTTQSGRTIALVPCGSNTPKCLQTDPKITLYAMPADNRMNCKLEGNAADTDFMIKVSSPQNPDYHVFDTYLKSTDAASIYIDRVLFSSKRSTTVSYTMDSEYNSAASSRGMVNMYFVFTTFDSFTWVQWSPFSGWNCFGTIGGLIIFMYILHSLVMIFVSLFFENPWANNSHASGESKPLVRSSYQELPDKASADAIHDL